MLVWLAIYPCITLIFLIFGHWLELLPIPLRTFVLTIVLVPYMVYVGVPALTKLLKPWLNK